MVAGNREIRSASGRVIALTEADGRLEVSMLRGIQRLARDMSAKVVKQELIANNLANATTSGFKAQRAFVSTLNEAIGADEGGRLEPALGSYTSFAQGPIEKTHRSLDVAINGEGFFAIDTANGERFTRDGCFTLSDAGLLTTQSGDPVLGVGGPITITGSDLSVTPDGKVISDGEEVGTLKVVVFGNPQNLIREGNMFAAQGQPYDEVDMGRTQIIHEALERSNVSPIDEMVEMISIHRSFEAAQRSITLQDESAKQLIDKAGRFGG
jgi:flagellar basal-body rod protein FlgF